MNTKEKLAKAKKLVEEAQMIHGDPESTEEDKEKALEMFEDAKALRLESVREQEILELAEDLDELEKKAEKAEPAENDEPELEGSEFKEWGEFLYAIWMKKTDRFDDPRLRWHKEEEPSGHQPTAQDLIAKGHTPQAAKQMVESVGASGGFLVPAEFDAQLRAVQGEDAIVAPRATRIRMRRRQIDIPVLDQTASGTSGVPSWFGGMQVYYLEEATEKTLTEAEFKKVSLVAHKLICYTRASDELLDDAAISLSDFLAGPLGMAGAISWRMDYAMLRGTGAGQPLGVVTPAGATITVARAAGGTIGYIDLVNMLESFLPSARGVWVVTQTGMSNLLQIVDPNGNYIWQPNAREGVPQTVFGMPVIFTEKLPTVGNQGDILLADFRYYLYGDRQATTVESTKFDKWAYDQTSWRAVDRHDGQPWLSAPLTYQDQATQVSPFVILGAKST